MYYKSHFMDVKNKVGSRLKELRIKKELSQESLSRASGLDRTYISDVENGRRNVSIEAIERLLIGIGVSFNYFFNTKEFK